MTASGPARWTRRLDTFVRHLQDRYGLGIVELPDLDLQRVRAWFVERGVIVQAPVDTRIAGLLVAWRGRGVVMVDEDLSPAWKRLVVAHEVGHFELDHLARRKRVLDEQPSLVEVYDGFRVPTDTERMRVATYGLAVGPITHRVGQGPGDTFGEAVDVEDEATLFALDLLCPWPDALAVARSILAENSGAHRRFASAVVSQELVAVFDLPLGAAQLRARELVDELTAPDIFGG